ncbi:MULTISPECIES: manganese-dependent inorganic pyrophosphatase [Vibrio]|jgi:manganese-dependent inorganic pyrophosphatase|uniref:inorganic diphosphatase n=1 Tax=Vibrio splendidus TaxID=29497 RepID=A0A1B9QQN0_VIBSP|nr:MULTISPECIES: manganese-dependent inorganic pyrophosphatase [Vibrio]MBO7910128.1 manganese-dependent inorganic pyrophosphatase [Vibrio sp. G41H]MCC4861851.1 manganese-dependent inorganic pyrophosphatase [Vibrio splendidus]MCF7488958.1 manganese-dependent inorganic pyrophosphatase [Vibrio sp. G-C-1]MCW4443424.1 manganese-dependent inorganic pyrophosphatase [Vibrio splendidus]MDH5886695.1 manganese-dependent inorganic pyrophosphatase [Vibrio splendidus]
MILVVGHKNPDSDSICSALVATELLKARGEEATPIRQGEINRETQHILEVAGAEKPELRTSVAGEKIWLVDYSDLAQAPDDVAEAEIVGIVDHHRLGDAMTVNPMEAWIWPVGCTNTVLFNMFKIEGHSISQQIAKLMMSAILSDTVGFASPTCTQKDKDAVAELAEIAGVTDIDAFIKALLIAKTNIEGLSAAQLVEKDLKGYPFNGRDVVVGQVELATLEQVDGMIEALEADLEERCEKDGLAFAAVMLTDITTAQTHLLYKGEWADKLVKHEKDGVLMMENTLSRKKQGWPWLQGELV